MEVSRRAKTQKKAREIRLKVECNEFLAQGRTANKEYYIEVTLRFREAIHQKRTSSHIDACA